MATRLLRKFWKDCRGNYAMATVITAVPMCGAIGMAVDYAEMSRQRQVTLNALDAAGIATARRLVAGVTDSQAREYAQEFFNANIGSIKTSVTTLTVTLPNGNAGSAMAASAPSSGSASTSSTTTNTGGGTLKLAATLKYRPYFISGFRSLIGQNVGDGTIPFNAQTEIRLKNTLEVALVLDNSGSMAERGKGSTKSRIDLLKDAANQLVTLLINDAQQMKQISQPVRVSLVPFAASVNVGSSNDEAAWMDTTGISPVHNEYLNWKSVQDAKGSDYRVEQSGNAWYGRGNGWATIGLKDKPLTRFTVFDKLQRYANGNTSTTVAATSWAGCVEARPSPYNVNDATASANVPATLFVPMFAPDEYDSIYSNRRWYYTYNNWWNDGTENTGALTRQINVAKFFTPEATDFMGAGVGPNLSCTTAAITPLTDVTDSKKKTTIDTAISNMTPGGATNVPEGMAWGWRTVSSTAPFTEGRAESEKGNDKVVIVLTDGENTYYTPESLSKNDWLPNESIYSAFGYAKLKDGSAGRIFGGTSSKVSKTDFSNANYTKAMNEQFATLCDNAKAGNLIVMTVALDLDSTNSVEKTQIEALKACASYSKYSKDEDDPSKPAKLFWNSTGSSLTEDFKKIAKELSNLRIVG